MNKKFRAFSVSLGFALLILLGPRHPGGTPQFNPSDRFIRAADTAEGVASNEVMAGMTGQRLMLHNWGKDGCGDNLPIEDQLNCAIYMLNHPAEWLGR